MQLQNKKAAKFLFPVQIAGLCLIAIMLRWWNLDFMTFRFDQAEVAFRCMEMWQGKFPISGITNSLGFRNAPGYIWSLLPSFLITSDPVIATGWHGFLSATMIIPLALTGKQLRGGIIGWLPAIVAAIHPLSVFAGRNLWAQYLLLPCSAWCLFCFYKYLVDSNRKLIWLSMTLALALWGTSIHFSMAPFIGIVLIFGWKGYANSLNSAAKVLLPSLLIALTILPAVIDFVSSRLNPREVPEYAAKFEGILPDPLPWFERIQSGFEVVFYQQANNAFSDIAAYWDSISWLPASFDVIVVAFIAAGFLGTLINGMNRNELIRTSSESQFARFLLCSLLIPIVFAGFLIPRLNAGYFPASYPVVWASLLYLPGVRKPFVLPAIRFATAAVFLVGIWLCCFMFNVIAKVEVVSGSYYIPYRYQKETADLLTRKGVEPKSFNHLSGPWFGRSYEYILRYVSVGRKNRAFGLIDDSHLKSSAQRLAFLRKSQNDSVQNVAIVIVNDQDQANHWMDEYYSLPTR